MSATTFSIAPFEANTSSSAASSNKSSFSQPPTITLTLASADEPPSPAEQQQPPPSQSQSQHLAVPNSHGPALLSPPSPTTTSLSLPSPPASTQPPALSSPVLPTSPTPLKSALSSARSRTRPADSPTASPTTSASPLSPTSSRTRDRSPARQTTFSPKHSKPSSSASHSKDNNENKANQPPPSPPTITPETPPEWLTQPHQPVYQTHTTVRPAIGSISAKASRSVSFSRRKRKSTKIESIEERRDRFYRLLHSYHIHAEENDLNRHEVIFPPGLLAGEGDMNTFLGEFTALQSSYSALLTMLSSLPHLCLYLNADGCLVSYNHDPSAFLGVTLTSLQRTPYLTWFSESHHSNATSNGRHSFSSSRNQHFLSSINLAYSSRQAVRQEQCMFMPGNERVTPVTLTIIPVTYNDENASSFDDRFTWSPPHSPTAAATDAPDDSVSLSQHAFGADQDEQRRITEERAKAAEEDRILREQERRSQIRGMHVIIESKEHMYRLLQNTKRNKEILSTDKRRNPPASDRADAPDDIAARDRSILIVEPKLDTSISSALQLVGALQRQEKNARKRQMYADIMHMLANSKGFESVNDDVITQIEDSASVGADVKSWLINQINPTNQQEEKKDEVDELIANTTLGGEDSSAEASAHSSIFVPGGGRRQTTMKQPRASMAQQTATPQPGAAADLPPVDTARESTSTSTAGNSLRASTINPRASQQLAHRPSNAQSSQSSTRGGSLINSSSASASFSSPMTGDVELPKALTQSTDTDQYVDTSGEVSLMKKQRTSNTTGNGGSITAAGGTTERQSLSGTNGGGRTERRRTLKERKSLHEKKSLTSRASLANALQKLPASTATLTSATAAAGPVVAPIRPPLSLPLGMPFSDKHQVIERAADARVVYNNWSLPTGEAETSRDKDKDKDKDTLAANATEPDDGVIVIKESVFNAIGCSPPEVHHNAALDCNTQTLFWSNALPYFSTTRPVTAATARLLPHTLIHSPVYLTPSAENALAQSLSCLSVWNQFNIFHVSAHSQGWPLTFTFTSIVTQLNLVGKWGIDAVLLSNFIREVERGYFANPYHSSTHAADVLQHSYHMLTQTHLALQLSDLDIFLLLVAACLHDYGHPGVSNAYLTSTFSSLALQYNDRNVLESYHIASVFLLMQSKPECNLFQHMDAATYRKARKLLIDLVLATDLASHFDILAVWKRKESILDLSKDEDKLLVMQMILKSGDLGHPSRVRHLHLTWSELITEEFFQQGDRERKNGMNVSAMMDRHTCNIVTSQIGFISFLVMPIYSAFSPYIGNDMYHMLVKANLAMWERLNLETEELRRQKEDEEWALRRLAAEKEEMETRRKKEADDKVEEDKRKEEALEEEMRRQTEEEEKQHQLEVEVQQAAATKQQKEREQVQRRAEGGAEVEAGDDDESGGGELGQAPPLLDMTIRRENDSEWTINQLSDSESDEEYEEEVGQAGDMEEEAERQRRREKKQREREVQQAKLRSEKQQEKAAYRLRELEERRLREEQEKTEAEERRVRDEKQKDDDWQRSREREEREIDDRMRKHSESLHARYKRRSTDDSSEAGEESSTERNRHISLSQVVDEEDEDGQQSVDREDEDGVASGDEDDERDGSQLPVVEEEAEEEGDENTSRTQQSPAGDARTTNNADEDDGEYSAPPTENEKGPLAENGESASSPRPLSPQSMQQAKLAARLKESIAKDRQRVEAERDRERTRLSMERKKLMSAEERRAAEEAERLEKQVRRVLKREQAKARAKAREEEVKGLNLEQVEQTNSGNSSSRLSKEEVLMTARTRERSVALRAVSLLMMDKEWGMKRDREEEKHIMLTYLQSLPEDEQQEMSEELDGGGRRQSSASRRSAPKVADEEWEDDAETGANHPPHLAHHRSRRVRSFDSDLDSLTDASDSGLSDELGNDNELPLRMLDSAHSRKSSYDRQSAKGRRPTRTNGRELGHSRRQSGERQEGSSNDALNGRRRTVSGKDEKRSGRRATMVDEKLVVHKEEEKEETDMDRPRTNSRARAASKRVKSVSIQEDRNEVREHHSLSTQPEHDDDEEEEDDDMPLSHLFEQEEEEEEDEAARDQQRRARRRVEFAEEEKVMLSEASEEMKVNERQRKKDKQRAMQAQKHRENRQQRAAATPKPQPQYLPVAIVQGQESDGYPPMLPSPSSSASMSYSSPSLSSHPIASATTPSFTSFPPLTPPLQFSATVPAGMKLVRTSDGQEVMMADSRLINQMMGTTKPGRQQLPVSGDVEFPFVTPSNPLSMFASRPLAAARGGNRELHVTMASQSAELPGSDWRAVEDEQAMAAILRRVVPRSRQAELERARRAIMLKARMRETQ